MMTLTQHCHEPATVSEASTLAAGLVSTFAALLPAFGTSFLASVFARVSALS